MECNLAFQYDGASSEGRAPYIFESSPAKDEQGLASVYRKCSYLWDSRIRDTEQNWLSSTLREAV